VAEKEAHLLASSDMQKSGSVMVKRCFLWKTDWNHGFITGFEGLLTENIREVMIFDQTLL